MYQKVARFRDLRPPRTDTNLFSYHLKALMKSGYIIKLETGYTLSRLGLIYVDRLSNDKVSIREQPKIITMLVLTNARKEILLQQRRKQPFIGCWTLPHGKLHMDDTSIHEAAQREAKEKLGIQNLDVKHAGNGYIRVTSDGEQLTAALAHVFKGTYDGNFTSATERYVPRDQFSSLLLAPAVAELVDHALFHESFFVELNEDWYTEDI